MEDIFQRINARIAASGRKVLIGCEAAAGEPFIRHLPFNDLRFNINLRFGIPVPAYAYLHHEYVNNFMGNQNSVQHCVDFARSPLNLHQRLAYAFAAGDMMTVVLKSGGRMCWDWGTPWDVPGPDHDSVAKLIGNLNAWRRGAGKPYLVYGRMLKPFPLAGIGFVPMFTPKGERLDFPSLFTTRWTRAGRSAQVIVNYQQEEQVCILTGIPSGQAMVYHHAQGPGEVRMIAAREGLPLRIPPLSALLVEWDGPPSP
jgi:hypothetical protein